MKILFNPTLTTVPEYNFNGERVNIGGLASKSLKQYPEMIADDMVERWGFLQLIDSSQVEATLKKAKEEDFKCQYCDFITHANIGLIAHMQARHKDQELKKSDPLVDPKLVPVDTSKKIATAHQAKEFRQALENGEDLPSGIDPDGVFWYGEGVQEQNREFAKVRPYGQGHFGR